MTKSLKFLTFFIIASSLISCEDEKDGECNDNIKLSQKEVVFDYVENSIVINTQSTAWWLRDIYFNDTLIDLSSFDKTSKNFVITENDFQIERKEYGKKIVISMNKNDTTADRLLIIYIQNGNCYDAVRVTQKKE